MPVSLACCPRASRLASPVLMHAPRLGGLSLRQSVMTSCPTIQQHSPSSTLPVSTNVNQWKIVATCAAPKHDAAIPEGTPAAHKQTRAPPKRSDTALKHTNAGAKHIDAAPEQTRAAPKRTGAALKRSNATPKRKDTTSKASGAPAQHTDAAPEQTPAAPRRMDEAAKETDAAPKHTVARRKHTDAAANRTNADPKSTLAAPKRTDAAHNAAAAEPKRTTAARKRTGFVVVTSVKALTTAIKQSKTVHGLRSIVYAHLQSLDHIHVAAALRRLVELVSDKQGKVNAIMLTDHRVVSLVEDLCAVMDEDWLAGCDARALASSLSALSKLQYQDTNTIKALLGELSADNFAKVKACKAIDVANIINAVANLRYKDASVNDQLLKRFTRICDEYSRYEGESDENPVKLVNQDLSNILHACAVLNQEAALLLQMLQSSSATICTHIPSMNGQHLANSLWALCSLQLDDHPSAAPLVQAMLTAVNNRPLSSWDVLQLTQLAQVHAAMACKGRQSGFSPELLARADQVVKARAEQFAKLYTDSRLYQDILSSLSRIPGVSVSSPADADRLVLNAAMVNTIMTVHGRQLPVMILLEPGTLKAINNPNQQLGRIKLYVHLLEYEFGKGNVLVIDADDWLPVAHDEQARAQYLQKVIDSCLQQQ